MKTVSIITLSFIFCLGTFAQATYEEAMQNALSKFGSATCTEDMQASASAFERIADVESEEWLPSYYASLIYCILTFQSEDPKLKTAYVEQSQSLIDRAMKTAPEESEIHTLQGMIYQALMSIDPEQNGRKYGSKANGSFQTAIKLNAENPRPYYLQAISIMYTPEQYGGGKAAALPLFEQAMQLFNKQAIEDGFLPNWGKEDCEKNLIVCREEIEKS